MVNKYDYEYLKPEVSTLKMMVFQVRNLCFPEADFQVNQPLNFRGERWKSTSAIPSLEIAKGDIGEPRKKKTNGFH